MGRTKLYTIKMTEAQIEALLDACTLADEVTKGQNRTRSQAAIDRARANAALALDKALGAW